MYVSFCRFIDLQGSQTRRWAGRVKKSFVGLSIYKVLKPSMPATHSPACFVGLSIYKVLKLSSNSDIHFTCFVGLSIYKVLKPAVIAIVSDRFCRFIDLQGSQTLPLFRRPSFCFVGLSIYKVLKLVRTTLSVSTSFVGLSIYKVLKRTLPRRGFRRGFVGLSIYKVLKPRSSTQRTGSVL